MYVTNLPAGSTFTTKDDTSCNDSKGTKFWSLEEAKAECTKDSECYGIYDDECKGGHWYLCPYNSLYREPHSCTYVKEGKT